MEEYTRKICPFCKKEIKEADAIKVCPECGIPHHGVCWEKNNGCTSFGCSHRHYKEQRTDSADVCVKCGAPLGDVHDFCPQCGTPRGGKKKRICRKCGAELQEEHDFCPRCGTKYAPNSTSSAYGVSEIGKNNEIVKKNNKKKLIPIIAAVIVVAIGLVLFLIVRGKPVSEVSFSKDTITVTEGKTTTLVCTVSPDDAKDKMLIWKSSNESVAKVDEKGNIIAVSEGSCTIKATSANGKSDECRVIVEKAGPDLKGLYSFYCESKWADYGLDGSYLSIDTNPDDRDDDGLAYPDAYYAIEKINNALGLPSSLINDMAKTSASQGKQSETFDSVGVTVSWTYHPDKGLEVTYKLINK